MIVSHLKSILERYQSNRLISLDIFRGMTIFTMILVNNPGSWATIYAPLKHADWHGWTLTDLVFPFFLFIVGISISLSFSIKNTSEKPTVEKQFGVLIRSLKLIVLGWILGLSYYNFYSPEFSWFNDRLLRIRWFGVLQRIGIVYFVCASIYIWIAGERKVLISSIGLLSSLILYWIVMMFVSYQDSNANSLQGFLLVGNNLAAYIDHNLFGTSHLYHKSSNPFSSDPEGLLTTLPALASCFVGIIVSEAILKKESRLWQAKQLAVFGLLATAVACLISIWIPFNKNLWTPSYVFLSSGLAMILLGICIYCIDHRNWKLGFAPFIVFGANSIALFMLSGFVARLMSMIKYEGTSIKGLIYQNIQLMGLNDNFHSLTFAIVFMSFMYLPLFYMYKNSVFWKI